MREEKRNELGRRDHPSNERRRRTIFIGLGSRSVSMSMSVDRSESVARSGLVCGSGGWVCGSLLKRRKRNIFSRAQLDGEGVSDNSKLLLLLFLFKDMS